MSAALASEAMTSALALARWVGDGKQVTAQGQLRPGPAFEACVALGISLPPGKKKLRSANDVPVLSTAWRIARSAGVITVSGGSVYGLGFQDLAEDPAAALEAWLRAATAPIGPADEPCPEFLAVVAVMASAAAAVTVAEIRDAAFAASDDMNSDQHAEEFLADLTLFGALTSASGDLMTITPLGRLLTDSVFAGLAPAPGDDAAVVVTRLRHLPVNVGIKYARDWLAPRSPADAAGELIDAVASATPHDRVIAIDLAAEIGPDAAAAWRERAELPGYGAYVREWLIDRGEDVPVLPGDVAWMSAEAFGLALAEAPRWLGKQKVAWALEEAFDIDDGDPLTVLKESGHPDAAHLIELVEQEWGLRSSATVTDDKPIPK
jgi:hypothetical protein